VRGEGIGVAAVFGKVGVVFVLARVLLQFVVSRVSNSIWLRDFRTYSYLLSAHEQKMLYSMCNARQVFRIAEAANIDIHGRRGLVCVGIVDEQGLKLVGQLYDSVGAFVEERFVQSIGQAFDAGGSAVRDRLSHHCEGASACAVGRSVRGKVVEGEERAVSSQRARTQLRCRIG
jgi:hypothetical protein